ncbi:hypothetical protein GGF31_001264 [Allomyces arbusculus]|nr:hypothetical protein GGF31_001264 [Allomyces arbusculus]
MALSNFPRMAWAPPTPHQLPVAPAASSPASTTNVPASSVPSYDPAISISVQPAVSHGGFGRRGHRRPRRKRGQAAAPLWGAGPVAVPAAAPSTVHGPGVLATAGMFAATAQPMLSTGGAMPNGYRLAAPMLCSVPATTSTMPMLNSVCAAPPTPQLAPQDGPEYTVVFNLSAPTTHAPGTAYPIEIDAPAVHVRDPATGHGTTLSLPDTIYHAAAAAFPMPIQLLLQALTGMPAALAETLCGVGCAPVMAGTGDQLGAFTAPWLPTTMTAVPTPAAAAAEVAPATWTPVATPAGPFPPSVAPVPVEQVAVPHPVTISLAAPFPVPAPVAPAAPDPHARYVVFRLRTSPKGRPIAEAPNWRTRIGSALYDVGPVRHVKLNARSGEVTLEIARTDSVVKEVVRESGFVINGLRIELEPVDQGYVPDPAAPKRSTFFVSNLPAVANLESVHRWARQHQVTCDVDSVNGLVSDMGDRTFAFMTTKAMSLRNGKCLDGLKYKCHTLKVVPIDDPKTLFASKESLERGLRERLAALKDA